MFFLCSLFKLCDRITAVSLNQKNICHFFVKWPIVWLGHITHLWPYGTPSGTQMHNPYHQTFAFFLCSSNLVKTHLARRHLIKKTLSISFLCENPSLGLQGPYHTSMAIGNPLRHPRPQPLPPNYCILPLSKLCDRSTGSKVSSNKKNIISVLFLWKEP